MKLRKLLEELQDLGDEYLDMETVVPIGMDCATVKRVEIVLFNPKNGRTMAGTGERAKTMKAKFGVTTFKIAVYISPSEEPRP